MPPLEKRTDSPGESPEVAQDPCQHWRGKVGISIKDQTGEIREMDDILDEMGAKWKTLSND